MTVSEGYLPFPWRPARSSRRLCPRREDSPFGICRHGQNRRSRLDMDNRCPSHQTRHTWPLSLENPVRSGMLGRGSESISSKGMQIRFVQFSFPLRDPFWHQHLGTKLYVFGIRTSPSPRARAVSLSALLYPDSEPSLPPAPVTGSLRFEL